jgi:3-phenylpropionate/trans-cinnamate dioxygenase ferredoxin reductase subunit
MILRLQAGDNAAVQQIVSTPSPSAEAAAGAALLRWYIMSFPERTVVTGAGVAGFRVVEELRRRGYSGQITLIGAEDRPPYDRPPLSKKVLTDGIDPSLHADFKALDVDFRPGETAMALESPPPAPDAAPTRASASILVTNRDKYAFDHLVVATGAIPVTLPGPGRQRFLRTYDDALALRALLGPRLRLAIVGAGWIGAELATAAVAAGCQVTVVEAGPAPLAAALGAQAGARTAPWYERAGVALRTGTAVESVQHGGLALAGGGWLAADEVVTAVGVRPAVGWLAGSGVVLEGGVAVDSGLRASVPGVYAAGDCAAFESRRFGRRLRVEHWDVALHAPEVVATNICGGAEVYDPVPYFWSEQFGRMVQYAGLHTAADRLLWRGDPEAATWSACWLTGPQPPAPGAAVPGPASPATRLTAVLTVGRPRDLLQARRLIAAGAEVDPARLADPAIPLKDAAG